MARRFELNAPSAGFESRFREPIQRTASETRNCFDELQVLPNSRFLGRMI